VENFQKKAGNDYGNDMTANYAEITGKEYVVYVGNDGFDLKADIFRMPANYVKLKEDEMMYVDGGYLAAVAVVEIISGCVGSVVRGLYNIGYAWFKVVQICTFRFLIFFCGIIAL
jgi:hypothetical protein